MLNKQDNASILKLKQILSSRYGKGLEIRQLIDMSGEASHEELQLRGCDLHIPIRVQEAFLGTAIIPDADDLDQENKRSIAQVVRMILEPTLYSWYLDRRENNLKSLNSLNFETENLSVIEPSTDSDDDVTFIDKPKLISNLLHLTGTNHLSIKKVALQIHEMTHRWAFIPFRDIAPQLNDVDDLLKLGAMTILIEDIETLGDKYQDLVLEYMSAPRAEDEPLLISTSSLSISDLAVCDRLNQELSDEIAINCFDVDRAPLSFVNLREVLELFFFKMKGENPT